MRRGVLAVTLFVLILASGYALWPEIEAIEEKIFQPSARLLAVGDMFFDRSIREYAQMHGFDYLFSCLARDLRNYDLVFGNLESSITDFPSKSIGTKPGGDDNYTFTSPVKSARALYKNHIRLVNIGNNHVGNFGRKGITKTKGYLTDAGVSFFGGLADDSTIYRTTLHTILVSFIGYNEFGGLSAASTTEIIRAEVSAGRITLVYTHWGEEYEPPLLQMRQLAHSFIDAGAAIVIGSHPHIVQENELYRGRWIYYSLGNFIFDQYWNDSVSRGLALDLTISGGDVEVKERPVVLGKDRRTCFENAL